jgi:hypothetical protein
MKGLFRAWDRRGFGVKASEAFRRTYRDLVKGRSRARVVVAEPPELSCRPVFVLGTFRSGTTLLRYLLDSHSRISIPAESEFIGSLAPLLEDTRNTSGFEALGLDRQQVVAHLRSFTATFFENYARSWNKPRWGDKTPSYVDHLDLIHRLFPEAQYVVISRHPLDQAHSFSRGGEFVPDQMAPFCQPDEDARLGATRFWKDQTDKLLEFSQHHPESSHQIRYEDLCSDPEQVMQGVLAFLEEAWEPKILELQRFDHDVGMEDGRAIAVRTVQFSGHHYLSWPAELLSACEEIAGATMRRLRYEIETPPSATEK